MDDATLRTQVGELRARGLTPKQIARTLGLSRAIVDPLIRAHAQTAIVAKTVETFCWVSPDWSRGLSWQGHADWDEAKVDPDEDEPTRKSLDEAGGPPALLTVVVAREQRYGRFALFSYLVDAQCLGVKNVIGPRAVERAELSGLAMEFFQMYEGLPPRISLELARELVLGAEAYARQLGFAPHPDFAACREPLGAWAGPGAIRFGWHGKPFFAQGPDDDPGRVLATLKRTVGEGNFDFLTVAR